MPINAAPQPNRPRRRPGLVGLVAVIVASVVALGPSVTGLGPVGRADAAAGTSGLTFVFLNPQKEKLALAGVEVTLVEEGGTGRASAASDNTGRAAFTGIADGTWDAVITPPQAGSATRLPVRVDGLVLTAGETVYRGVVLKIGASIGGTLRNASGAALPGVAVVIRVGKTPDVVGRAVTDSRGHFWIRGVATGGYSLQYNPPQGIPRPYETAYETWSFWGHAPGTAFSFALIHVVNASAGNVQSVLDGQDGVLIEGDYLETDVANQGTTTFANATLTYAGEGLGSTFTFPVRAADANGAYGFARVVPGRYKVSVTGTTRAGAPITYYYTGEDSTGSTRPPSLSPAAAAWVVFTDGDTIDFPAAP